MKRRRSRLISLGLFLILGVATFPHPARASDTTNEFSKEGVATFEIVEPNGKKDNTNGQSNIIWPNSNNNGSQTTNGKIISGNRIGKYPQTNLLASFGLSFVGGLLFMFILILLWLRRRKNEET